MTQKIVLNVVGMHCSSCAMSIDGELEDTGRVISASTNYAAQKTIVTFDPDLITPAEIIERIRTVGYEATPIE